MAELTELIRTKSSSENDGVEDCTEFVSFFPDFIWIVRDFTLDLKLHGHPVTEDEYLENALKLIPGIRARPGHRMVQDRVGSAKPAPSPLGWLLYLRLFKVCRNSGWKVVAKL